jgi:hypothetical protein
MSLQKMSLEPIKNFDSTIKMNNYIITNTFVTDKYLYVSYINDKGWDNPNDNNVLVQYDINTEKKIWGYKYKSRLPKALFSTKKYLLMSVVNPMDRTGNSNEIIKLNIKDGKLQDKLTTIQQVLSIFIEKDTLYTASTEAIKMYDLNKKLDEPTENILFGKNIKLKVFELSANMKLIVDNNFMYLGYKIPKDNYTNPDIWGLCKINKDDQKIIWNKRFKKGNTSVLHISNDLIYTSTFNKDLEYPEDFSSNAVKLNTEGKKSKTYKYTDENKISEYGDVTGAVTSVYVNFGLVFAGASDGMIRIFDEKSGKLLCRLLHYDEDEEVTPINDINIFKKHLYISSELDVKKMDLSKIPVLQKHLNKTNTKKQTQNTNTKKTITDIFIKELNFKDINECKKRSTKNNNSLTKNELIKKINEYPEIKNHLPANLNSIKKDEICEAIFKLKK